MHESTKKAMEERLSKRKYGDSPLSKLLDGLPDINDCADAEFLESGGLDSSLELIVEDFAPWRHKPEGDINER